MGKIILKYGLFMILGLIGHNFILNLYENNFPNYVFIRPNEIAKRPNTIFCKESERGYFS